MQNEQDKLELLGRKRLALSAVDAVDGYSEQSLKITLIGGITVRINGAKIKITSFSKSSGNLTAEGEFSEIRYGGTKTPFIKRLFK